MPILFKSSKFETYGYYFIFPFLMCISVFFIIGILSYDGSLSLFLIGMIVIFCFTFITSMESLLRLKNIEVNENNILIKNSGKIIEYKDVVYVYNLININGTSLVVWYRDTQKNKLKVILVRPERESPSVGDKYSNALLGTGELGITKFIREKSIKSNSDYLNIDNPRWFLFSVSPTFRFFK